MIPWMVLSLALSAGPGPGLEGPSADQCRVCHNTIWEEWKRSYHALSSTNRNFQIALQNWVAEEGHGPEDCLACHAPRQVLVTGMLHRPTARAGVSSEGVNCIVCHDDGTTTFHGPYDMTAPHAIAPDRAFRTARACTACHGQEKTPCGKEVQGWELSGLKTRSVCQTCHMPSRQDKLVQWINLQTPTRRVASHAFPGVHDPDFLAGAVGVEMEVIERRIVIRIVNHGAAHQVPASPWRKLIAQVDACDALGHTISRTRDGFFQQRGNAIFPDRPGIIEMRQRSPMARIRVTLRYYYWLDQPDDEASTILEKEFKL